MIEAKTGKNIKPTEEKMAKHNVKKGSIRRKIKPTNKICGKD